MTTPNTYSSAKNNKGHINPTETTDSADVSSPVKLNVMSTSTYKICRKQDYRLFKKISINNSNVDIHSCLYKSYSMSK